MNRSGQLRMLLQRLVKLALLQSAGVGLAQVLAGAGDDGGKAGSAERLIRLKSLESLENIAIASEDLLSVFEQLSVCYEQSMQMLVG